MTAATANGNHHQHNDVLVMYKVVNSKTDASGGHPSSSSLYNAFRMPLPRGSSSGLTLKSIKQHCVALHSLNAAGPDGFHWRVCMEDNRNAPSSSKGGGPVSYSFWDVQDENARLPIKEATPSELEHMFHPTKSSSSSSHHGSHSDPTATATKAAKGAFKTLGKAIGVDSSSVDHSGPRVGVIAFKLLDLVKLHDDFDHKHRGSTGAPAPPRAAKTPRASKTTTTARTPAPPRPASSARAAPAAGRAPPAAHRTPHAASAPPQQRAAAAASAQRRSQPQQQQKPGRPAAEASLMNFDTPDRPAGRKSAAAAGGFQHMNTAPADFQVNETRAQRLKREYAQKKHTQNRVWDEIDQRWVEVDTAHKTKSNNKSAPPAPPTKKDKGVKGISLDPSNAVGKSAHVQAAVNKRVNDMRASQNKALQEIREREDKKKSNEAEEDVVRKRLEPKIKAWSEEHGKKKQLRALLASLHIILWPDANWKPVTIGDILDDSKCKRCFHKASRVVHPDKTHHLDAEKRFLAKRIFDALSQAKTEFDNGAK